MNLKPITFFSILLILLIAPTLTLAQTQTPLYGFNSEWLKSTVVVIYQSQYGTGWWVNPTHVVTAAHVVNYQAKVAVTIVRGNTRVAGTVVAVDSQKDVAVISVSDADKIDKYVLKLSRDVPDYGSTIFVIGYPAELLQVVGSVEKMSENPRVLESSLTWHDPSYGIFELGGITDAGNSGGPVLDASGNVVGLVSFALTGKAGTLYFATDVENIKQVLQQAGVTYELGNSAVLPDNPAVAGATAGLVMDIIVILAGVALGAAFIKRRG